ncbi:MAG: hypothetical protein FWG05_01465 [Kiritimatiellaeota bacterium]|nr:hypothetical protein [Kiritimatiellota bacterium]
MTKKEFTRAYLKFQFIPIGLLSALFVSCAGIGRFVLDQFEDSPSKHILIAFGAMAFVFGVLGVITVRLISKRFFGIKCPECAKGVMTDYTLVYGLCFYCGKRIFDLPKSIPEHEFVPLEYETVVMRNREHFRKLNRTMKNIFIPVVFVFVVSNIDDLINNRSVEFYSLTFIALFFLVGVLMIIFSIPQSVSAYEKCPNCGKRIGQRWQFLARGGLCHHCGRVVTSPPKDDDDGPALTRAEWMTRLKKANIMEAGAAIIFLSPMILVLFKTHGEEIVIRAVAFVLVTALILVRLRHKRHAKIRCPRCAETLAPLFIRHILSSGRCPMCGGKVMR